MGTGGNDTAPYFINTAYGLGRIELADGFIYTNSVPNRLFDPSIRPERKNAFEIGTDLRFWNNRIGLTSPTTRRIHVTRLLKSRHLGYLVLIGNLLTLETFKTLVLK